MKQEIIDTSKMLETLLDGMEHEIDTSKMLEALIDDIGLNVIIAKLGNICLDKSDHIATNWHDKALAKKWERCGKKLSALSVKI